MSEASPDTGGITFNPRWKEELVCSFEGRRIILEFTMGINAAHLPDESHWRNIAPAWAIGEWQRLHDALKAWCEGSRIPLYVDGKAWALFEEKAEDQS